MATVEHCLYCFETLAAHLEDRDPLSLEEVEKSWAEYLAATGAAATAEKSKQPTVLKTLPALRRLAAGSSAGSSSSSSSTAGTSGLSTPSETETETETDDTDDVDTPMTSTSSLPETVRPPPPTESPLFVTWNKLEDPSDPDSEYALRGCIGTFEPQPLADGLASYALTSALEDTRFKRVSRHELPRLSVSVTLLTDFEDAEGGALDWDLGTHGLRISFYYHGRRYGATYLPDVAPEQGWTKEETVVSLMRKAGWMGRRERWREVELKVVRYQGRKESLGYAGFRAWRDWLDARGKA